MVILTKCFLQCKHRAMIIARVPPLLWHKAPKYEMNAAWLCECEHCTSTLPKETRCQDACNSNSIITMYGNTEVTPAVHGCHFISCYILTTRVTFYKEKDKVWSPCDWMSVSRFWLHAEYSITSLVPRPHPAFRRMQIFRSRVGRAWEWGYSNT